MFPISAFVRDLVSTTTHITRRVLKCPFKIYSTFISVVKLPEYNNLEGERIYMAKIPSQNPSLKEVKSVTLAEA